MAKVTIAGDALVVTSAMKLEDLRTIAKYRPDALILKGGEDGKEPIFGISVPDGNVGSINKYGATFCAATRDDEKLATLTMILRNVGDEDVKEIVADKLGSAIIHLNTLEDTFGSVLEEISTEKARVMESIEIA